MKTYDQLLPKQITAYIPAHTQGFQRDMFIYKKLENEDPIAHFKILKNRLTHINQWDEFCKISDVHFTLMNDKGENLNQVNSVGDLIKIEKKPMHKVNICEDLFADWVIITKFIEIDDELISCAIIELSPTINPFINSNETKHFYRKDASNTFILYRVKNTLSVSIHGRNEILNSKVSSKLKLARNIFISNFGLLGIDNLLWKDFARCLFSYDS